MDVTQFQEIAPYYFVPKSGQAVALFANKDLVADMDNKVQEQITNVALLPGRVGPAMTMPDAHWGYGFPIGGVAAFDPEQGGIISAGGVGFDISCGVRCLRSNLFIDDVLPHIERLADKLFEKVPAGVGEGGLIQLNSVQLDRVLLGGAQWAVHEGYGNQADLRFVEENGCMQGANPHAVSPQAKHRQLHEMGTLGSGNHYLEIETVEKIYDAEAALAFGIAPGQIIIAIHCGSRGLGHQIGSDYLVALAKEAKRFGITLPDRELACAPILSPEGERYIGAMNAGINCALANRQIITHLTKEVFAKLFPNALVETLYDVSHNTCKKEKHAYQGRERWLYVHRKGATRALPPNDPHLPSEYRHVGQPVFIGGSMGTGSYLLAGNDANTNKAFASASHGSGRRMSRSQALKKWDGRTLVKELAAQGIFIRTKTMRGAAEEAPLAYKDVDEVAAITEKAGLARRVAFLRPLAVVKG